MGIPIFFYRHTFHPPKRGALKGRALVDYAELLNDKGAVSEALWAWESSARPPCWVVARSEAQRVEVNEIKLTIILSTY